MKTTRSRSIVSNQNAPHPELETILRRHQTTPFRKPIARHTAQAFAAVDTIVHKRSAPLILDSGCGTGDSTQRLAEMHPHHFVIGVDKSEARLSKNPFYSPLPGWLMASKHRDFQPDEASAQPSNLANNLFLVRADVIDFWRLALEHNWSIDKHYVLYPNPWPKKRQIKRRFHGHPVFFDMIRLAKYIELRSNWQIYAEEFAIALSIVAHQKIAAEEIKVVQHYFSPFEKKYAESGHRLFRVAAEFRL